MNQKGVLLIEDQQSRHRERSVATRSATPSHPADPLPGPYWHP